MWHNLMCACNDLWQLQAKQWQSGRGKRVGVGEEEGGQWCGEVVTKY